MAFWCRQETAWDSMDAEFNFASIEPHAVSWRPQIGRFKRFWSNYNGVAAKSQKWTKVNKSVVLPLIFDLNKVWSNYNGVAAKSQKRTKVEKNIVFPF